MKVWYFIEQNKVDVKDNDGKTAIDREKEGGFSNIVPSVIPNLFVKEPVAMFRTMNSIGNILLSLASSRFSNLSNSAAGTNSIW